jgi:hypothetical protein
VQQNALAGPRSAVGYALGGSAPAALPALAAGTAMAALPEAPGGELVDAADRTGTQGSPTKDASGTGAPIW